MAGKIVDVTLRLNDKLSNPLGKISTSLKNNARQWERAGKQIQNAGKNIINGGSNMTKKLTVPIAGAGVACVKMASDFEAGMSKVQSISGATQAELDKLSEKAKEMGAKTKFSATESSEAFSYMAMAGWKTADMLDGIEGIMYLAGATGEDLASTSDIVTDALTAFGMKASDTQRFVDVLASASSNANTNVSMLGESFKYVAPVAGSLGYNVEDVATGLSLMANSGIKASQAGTAMRSMLTNLAKPTKQSGKAMKDLGISLTDSKGNMKSFDALMKDLRGSFSKLDDAQKAQYASMLAGKTGMSGLLAIVNSSDSDFNKLSDAINNSSGACKNMYDVANNNLQGQLTVLKSTVESIAISFGERLAPYVKKLTAFLQMLATKFNGLTDAQKDTIVKIALIVASIGPALLVFGKMVLAVGKVVSFVGKLGKALKMFGSLAGIIASPAGIVILVLGAIVVAVILVIKNWKKLKPTFEKVINAIKKAITKMMPTFNKIKAVIMSMVKTVAKQMPKIQKAISSAFKKVLPVLKMAMGFIKKVGSVIAKVLTKAIQSAMPVVKKIGDTFNAVFPVIVKIVSKAISIVSGIIAKLAPVFKTYFSIAGDYVKFLGDTISSIFDGIMTVVGGILDFITGVFTGNWSKAWEGVKSIFSGIFSTFETIAKAPLNAIITLINGAIKGFNKIKIPDWVPMVGGKGINIPLIPTLAKGTDNWKGGIVQISERGGEIVDLPSGSRVYPHDKSVQKAYKDGQKASGGCTITIPKIADQIIVREDADIDKIAQALANKLEKVSQNLGGGKIGYIY